MKKSIVVAGLGELSMGAGIENITQTPFISFNKLLKPRMIGDNVYSSDESEELLTVFFKNLESLEILEKMCKVTRKVLSKQSRASQPKVEKKEKEQGKHWRNKVEFHNQSIVSQPKVEKKVKKGKKKIKSVTIVGLGKK